MRDCLDAHLGQISIYYQNRTDRWTKECIVPFRKMSELGISIVAKIHNTLLCNRIEPKIEKILWENQNGFRINRSTTSQILTIRRILGLHTKNLEATILFVRFSKAFDSIHRGKMEQILLAYGLPNKQSQP